jgi:hypothetical protein
VAGTNINPVIVSAPPPGQRFSALTNMRTDLYALAATDANNDTLSYRYYSNPPNLGGISANITSSRGAVFISFSILPRCGDVGEYSLCVEITDSFSFTPPICATVTVILNRRPTLIERTPRVFLSPGCSGTAKIIVALMLAHLTCVGWRRRVHELI